MAVLAVCARACERCIWREASQGVAADRVARGRGCANQILALDTSEKHLVPRSGRCRQAALACRARLPGAQAGGRARAFRGARMARLPSSRHAVHRGLRIPDLRKGARSAPVYPPVFGERTPLLWRKAMMSHLSCRSVLIAALTLAFVSAAFAAPA